MSHTHPAIDCESLLQAARLRRTPGRIAILDVLARADAPLSRTQIASHLKTHNLDKVTIYRALNQFVRAGVVHRAYLRQREAFFELAHHCSDQQCHPHFQCTACGQTHCLLDADVPLLVGPADFLIRRQLVRLEGLCPRCR